MSVFSGMSAIAWKEFLHVVRDPSTRFVLLIPVLQMLLFGYAIRLDVENIPTAVVDLDRTAESRELVAAFANTRTFDPVATGWSVDEAESLIVAGDVQVAVVVPDGFAREVRRGGDPEVLVLIDGSHSSEATAALSAAQAIGVWTTPRLPDVRVSQHDLRADVPAPVHVNGRLLFNPNLRSATFFVPGLVGIILQLVCVLLTSFAIVRERELGTFEQLMVTPVGAWGLLLGKLAPYAVIAVFETALVLTLMVHVFGVPIVGSLPLLAVLSALFVLTSLALGVIISTVATNQAEAMQMTFLILLPSILLSGFVFPLQTIPDPVRPISYAIPVRYFIEILRGIILRGAPFEALWHAAAALGAYTVALLAIGAVRFRRRLD